MKINIICRIKFIFIALLITTWVNFTFAGSETGIESLNRFNQMVMSYKASFEQTIIDEKQKVLERAKGKMFLQRPGKFRWEYQQPYSQLIVSDGDKIWLYDQELEHVTVKSLSRGLGDTPAMLLSSRRALTEDFYVRDIGSKQGLRWVKLTPKNKDLNFEHISLAFSNSQLHSMVLLDKLGQTTQIKFSSVNVNPNLSQQLFRFTPPPGVDIDGADG